jgi:hypothetical protein
MDERETPEARRLTRARFMFDFLARTAGITETRLPANWDSLSPEVRNAFTDLAAWLESAA